MSKTTSKSEVIEMIEDSETKVYTAGGKMCKTEGPEPCIHCIAGGIASSVASDFNIPLGKVIGMLTRVLGDAVASIGKDNDRDSMVKTLLREFPGLVQTTVLKRAEQEAKDAKLS